jgi:hypothetical protein
MATLLDLLKAKGIDPTQISSQMNRISQDPAGPNFPYAPSATPSPEAGPVQTSPDVPATPLSPEMLGLQSTPNSSQMPDLAPKQDTQAVPQVAKDDDNEAGDDAANSIRGLFSGNSSGNAQALQQMMGGANGGFTNNTVDNLKQVQGLANQQQAQDNIMRGVASISGGLIAKGANTKVPDNSENNKFYDNLDAQGKEKIGQFKEMGEQEKNDPQSQASVQARKVLGLAGKAMGFTPPETMTYNQVKEFAPGIEKLGLAKETRDARHEDLAFKYKYLANQKGDKQEAKQHDSDTKRLDAANKLITSGLASSRSGFGKDTGNLMAIQNAKALLAGGNLDDIDVRQITETARVLDRVLSGGNPTISGTEHLTPDTARMKLAHLMEQVTNKRQGAGASSFLQNNLHTLDREENIAKERSANTMKQALGSFLDIAEHDPERWDAMVAEHPEIAEIANAKAIANRKQQRMSGVKAPTSQAPNSGSGHAPGDIVSVKGKQYKVGADGDSLEEIQ